MIPAARSELVKLRERTYVLGAVGMAAFMAVAMLMTVGGAGDEPSDRGPAGLILARDQLAAADGLGASLGNSVVFLGITALTLVAINTGGEYGLGTMRNLLIRQPRRVPLLLGKTIALLGYVAVAVVFAAACGVLVATGLAPGNDVETSAWLTASGWAATARGTGNLVIATWGFAALGLVLATVMRSAPAAIGAGVAYALPAEILLVAIAPDVGTWLPGQLLQALARDGTPAIGHATALVGSLAWILVAVVASAAVFRARDLAD